MRIARFALAIETLVRGEYAVWNFGDFCPYSILDDDEVEDDDGFESAELQAEKWRLLAAQYNAAHGQ